MATAGAAVAPAGLEHQSFAFFPDELEQIPLRSTGELSSALGQNPGPEDMAAEDLALLRVKIEPCQLGVGEDLEATLLVEVSGDRGDDPILAEEHLDRLDVDAFAFEGQQVAHLVIAIGQLDRLVAEVHLIAATGQLGRVGVEDLGPVAIVEVPGERLLLVGTRAGMGGLEEGDGAPGSADRLEVVEDVLHQEPWRISWPGLEPSEPGVDAAEGRRDDIADDPFGRRDHVQDRRRSWRLGSDELERAPSTSGC